MSKITGETETGFQFTIEQEARDDMEFLELVSGITEGHLESVPKALEMLLGVEQKKKLYEHCRLKSGRVPATKVFAEMKSIFDVAAQKSEEIKN